MATIDLHDEVFATLTQRGKVIATMKLSGVTSIAMILHRLRQLASKCVGLVTLNVRNSSQGWLHSCPIMLSPRQPQGQEAVQLSLF